MKEMKSRRSVVALQLWLALLMLGCAEEAASMPVQQEGEAADAGGRADGAVAGDSAIGEAKAPFVSAAGIGVGDLEAATAFYTEVLGLELLYELETPVWDETVLVDVRGNHVVLMDFVRERNTTDNPVKLVFAVSDAAAYHQKVIDAGGSSLAEPTTFAGTRVALTFDLDGYLVELIEVPTVPSPVLAAVGIGVSSLDDAADYYTRVLGLEFVRDIDVPGFMDEKELASLDMRGPRVVLMHYDDETRSYEDIPAKIVFAVDDAESYAAGIESEDPDKLLQPPAPYADSGLLVGMARDRDGYLIEVVQALEEGG